jgi:SNF2 family DNA or RNA helicase
MENYLKMETQQVLSLKKGGKITAINAAVVHTKLLQIASGAAYNEDGEYTLVASERYELVIDLVEQRKHSIVFFNWEHQRDELIKEAKKRGLSYAVYDGSVTSDTERAAIVDGFQIGQYRVLFAHPQSAGHGLTLTKGTATIWASPTYNLEHFRQGLKRIYRIGQGEKTETIVIVAEGTRDAMAFGAMANKDARMTDLLAELAL